MKKYSSSDFDILHKEYQDILPVLEDVATKTKDKIASLLNPLGLPLAQPIQYRVKSWESTKEKLERGEVDIKRIIELQDLIGLRVIVLFIRDIEKVGNVVSKSFHVIKKHDKKDGLGIDKFGYLSTHFVVDLDIDILGVQEYLIPNFIIEIQVRTLAQHLWAEVSHLLSYKREDSVPPTILRELNRTAAFLESVDSSFEKILNERENYRKGIVDLETDNPLNVDLLQVTLDALWPSENKLEREPYGYLLNDLRENGVDTQRKLTELIRKHRDDVIKRSAREAEYLRSLAKNHPVENDTIKVVSQNNSSTHFGVTHELLDKVDKGIFYGHVALTVTALQFETGERHPLDPLD